MTLRDWVRPPRHLLLLFAAITGISTIALVWSSWQMVEQDRALSNQRAKEQRDAVAGMAVNTLEQRLAAIEQILTRIATAEAGVSAAVAKYLPDLAPGALVLLVGEGGVQAYPAGRVRYLPTVSVKPDLAPDLFAAIDSQESATGDLSRAMSAVRPLTRSSDAVVRAHALIRLARQLRRAEQPEAAARAYAELGSMGNVHIEGIPSDLLARWALCDLYETAGRRDDLLAEARAIDDGLRAGRWRIVRPVYDAYAGRLGAILGIARTAAADQDAEPLSAAADLLWTQRATTDSRHGRAAVWTGGHSVLVVSRRSAGRLVAFAATPTYVESQWMNDISTLAASSRTSIALTDAEGRAVIGSAVGPAALQSIRLSPGHRLPWTLTASSQAGAATASRPKTAVLLAGLAAIGLLVVGGSYLIGRAVMRELRVARLQANFVSAVSHEFRTPVTALRQMSELLADGRVDGDDLRQRCYGVLKHESNRLHRLVEGLLKFGRMEAGADRYQFEQIDAAELLARTVDEFRRDPGGRACLVELQMDGVPVPIRADREALGSVIWNLLDNAAKYAPDSSTVWVELARSPGKVAIHVRDRGIGLVPAEHERIFEKFVRGEAAERLGVPGSGIGLAVARRITVTHGGDITVESTPGLGSTFTIALPTTATPPALDDYPCAHAS